jgi:hypothetical protein
MFESTLEDPSREAIRRLVGLFKFSAVGLALGGVLVVAGNRANPLVAGVYLGFSLLCAAGAWMTANGLDERSRWARNAGFDIATLSLFSLGVGTIFGVIELYSLLRAQRGGQFSGDGDAA